MRTCTEPPHQDSDGVLDMSVAYLPGAMQFAEDRGVGWRRYLIAECHTKDINIRFLDPTNKVKGMNIEDEMAYTDECRQKEDWDALAAGVHAYRREDLRCVDYADFMIAAIDTTIHQCGTYDEIFLAERQHKPILAIINGGKKKAPDWLFDVVRHQEMFESVEECVEHLDRINKGEIKLDGRWVLIRKHLNSIHSEQEKI